MVPPEFQQRHHAKAVVICTPLEGDDPRMDEPVPVATSWEDVRDWGWLEWDLFLASLPPFEAGLDHIPDDLPAPVPSAVLEKAMEAAADVLAARLPTDVRQGVLPVREDDATAIVDGTAFIAKSRRRFRRIICVGDVHSSSHSLRRVLALMAAEGEFDAALRLSKGSAAVFLGDYLNRGPYSAAIVLFLVCFLLRNPETVYLLSGNHEDPDLWLSDSIVRLPFGDEVRRMLRKEGLDESRAYAVLQGANRLFSLFPTALFLRSPHAFDESGSWLQFSHGGFDPRLAGGAYAPPSEGGEEEEEKDEEEDDEEEEEDDEEEDEEDEAEAYDLVWPEETRFVNPLRTFLRDRGSAALRLDLSNSTPLMSDLSLALGDDAAGADEAKSGDYHLLKWSDLSGSENSMRLDPETGRWFFGRAATAAYLSHADVGAIVGGHQDLVPIGVFKFRDGGDAPAPAGATTGEYDFTLPEMEEEDDAHSLSIRDFLVLKTSIAADSKPGLFTRLCYIRLLPDATPDALPPDDDALGAGDVRSLQRKLDKALSERSLGTDDRRKLIDAFHTALSRKPSESGPPSLRNKVHALDSEFFP